ncbi:HNH endonuclease signature motif containing protein [Streptomyces sp. NPDC096040]|uniref:HNH endonuclease signature motif containing protein n=1 Tax=Streptomyces sp. NPDC096040 TaxID=3155541 RepID=UPI003322EF2D
MTRSIYDFPSGRERALARLAANTRPAENGECQGRTASTAAGYGRFKIDGVQLYAHRSSYEAHNGRVPSGLFILHSCDNPLCVNPAHLRTGTHQENMRDRNERGRVWQSRKTHCDNGHPFDEANARVSRGRRECRACHREASQKNRLKTAAAGASTNLQGGAQ